MSAARSIKLSARSAAFAVALWSLTAPLAGQSINGRSASYAELQALAGAGREVQDWLRYLATKPTDSGLSFENLPHFEDNAGRRLAFFPEGFEGVSLRSSVRYHLAFRMIGFSPGGLPLARLSQAASTPAYEGDIRENDPRLSEIRAALVAGQPAPTSIKLRYSGTRGDYLAFFDIEGREAFFRYREDRFDRRAERRIAGLIAGQAYVVDGAFLGLLQGGQFTALSDAEFRTRLSAAEATLVFGFTGARPLRVDQLLF